MLPHCVLMLAFVSQFAAAQTSPSSSTIARTTINFEIIGDVNVTANLTLWNEYPVLVLDTVYSALASLLNDVMPGTTPRRSTMTSTPKPEVVEEPMKWYWIMLIAIGGAIGVVAIILAIYFGIEASKAKKVREELPLLRPEDPAAPHAEEGSRPVSVASSLAFRYSQSGGGYAKVIQVPIVCNKAREGALPAS